MDLNKIKQLDLNLLKVFECLYLERNMSSAAKTLFISPSAVSHAVKRLRDALNDELFVRQGQTMQPTALCQQLAPKLIETLNSLRQVLLTAGEFELAKTTQTFNLAIHDALEPLVVPKIHQTLMSQAPLASMNSVKIDRSDMTRQLTTNQIDVAIDIALPIKLPIRHLVLSSDRFCVLMNKNHKLTENLTAEDYLKQKHLVVSSRAIGNVLEDFAFLQLGINRQIDMRCQNYLTAKPLLKCSNLLLTLPKIIANQLLDDELQLVGLPFELPPVVTHLYWHQNTEQDAAQIWFREKVQSCF